VGAKFQACGRWISACVSVASLTLRTEASAPLRIHEPKCFPLELLNWGSMRFWIIFVATIGLLVLVMCVILQTASAISFSGYGEDTSPRFTLSEGLAIFAINNSGSGNFIVWLTDIHGIKVDRLVNDAGNFDGAKALGISIAGDYILDITSDGPWNVNITEPRPQTAQSIPVSFRGRGQQVSDFFTLTPEHTRFEMMHDGENDFIVWLLDSSGNNVELLASGIGAFDGSKAIDIQDYGIYCLNIGADGNWTVDISH